MDELKEIRAGNAILLEWEVRDFTKEVPPLYDPQTSVTLTLVRPDGTLAQTQEPMTKIRVGVYRLIYQTVTGDVPDHAGLWTMEVETDDAGQLTLSARVGAFTLVA
jgi:uncharacterized protein YfaS (alpha-2-macroglobulin family)